MERPGTRLERRALRRMALVACSHQWRWPWPAQQPWERLSGTRVIGSTRAHAAIGIPRSALTPTGGTQPPGDAPGTERPLEGKTVILSQDSKIGMPECERSTSGEYTF